MAVVVLVGFSCAGKSSILDPLEKQLEKTLSEEQKSEFGVLDTDKEITKTDYPDGGIYSVFLEKTVGADSSAALHYIAQREKQILLSPGLKKYAVVAAGPMLLSHSSEWKSFCEANRPEIFWLKLSPKRTLERLKARQERYKTKLFNGNVASEHSNFGCWNDQILTRYDQETKQWISTDEATQLDKITEFMKYFADKYYDKRSHKHIDMNQLEGRPTTQAALVEKIRGCVFPAK